MEVSGEIPSHHALTMQAMLGLCVMSAHEKPGMTPGESYSALLRREPSVFLLPVPSLVQMLAERAWALLREGTAGVRNNVA